MYTSSSIQKIKYEYIRELVSEAYELFERIPVVNKTKIQKLLVHYIKTVSPAGLELWLNSVHEYLYFNEILQDFQASNNNFALFRNEAIEMIRADFGREDFRYFDLEKCKDEQSFLNLLQSIINALYQSLHKINKNLLKSKKINYSVYTNYKNSPMESGTDIKPELKKTPLKKIKQIKLADKILAEIWSEGYELFKILTDRINLVKSQNLVSYSHFHEPGISYINIIDRDLMDTVDDLVHENAHHHLNLLLKKYKLRHHKETDPVFYSPWRMTLRPLYGIFHAVFTFTYGAELFRQIVNSNSKLISAEHKDWARYRFCEEVLKNAYSLEDLNLTGYFTNKGKNVVKFLKKKNLLMKKDYPKIYSEIIQKNYLKELLALKKILSSSAAKYRVLK